MAVTLFNLTVAGPPPGTATTPAEQWIDLGLINTAYRWFFGVGTYASPDKSITFELRTNNLGVSTGTLANTKIIDTVAVSPKSGTLNRDMWKNGRLHITTNYGTGTEHCWLRLFSKTAAAGSYLYSLKYTLE